ncbi:MAG TPA: alkaline phosphatase family protein [Gemmatimonadaceae bacterium]|nr:alkaline phosphatase family protein [Gemmatimonadaceae bacterium]
MAASPSLIILVADGARADAFDDGVARGALPAIAQLRAEGGQHAITTAFPSVTGPAYAPFLTGRFPGPIGLPGLRWYDRAHSCCTLPPYCRSYMGTQMRHMDRDLDACTATLFELVPSSFNAMSMIGRGLARRAHLGRSLPFLARMARTHWRGKVAGWLDIDRFVARTARRCMRERAPALSFVALLALDKTSHATGHDSPAAQDALVMLDAFVRHLRHDAERAGRWDATHLWIVSDHGHSCVRTHDELAQAIRDAGHRVIAHPWVFTRRADAAVMVSGNAMAHVYLEPARRERPWWPALRTRWEPLVAALLERESVDIVMLPHSSARCEIRAPGRGAALLEHEGGRFAYRPMTGDPLGVGPHERLTALEAWCVSRDTDYPDSLVQIAHLAGAARSGDVILSAAPGWDFRAAYEPIPHASTHGALHRQHMLVPLLTNHAVRGTPRRTADVMPSALRVLGQEVPEGLDGVAFV